MTDIIDPTLAPSPDPTPDAGPWLLQLWVDPSRDTAPDDAEQGPEPEPLRHSAATWLSTGRFKFALLSVWNPQTLAWDEHEDFVKPEPL